LYGVGLSRGRARERRRCGKRHEREHRYKSGRALLASVTAKMEPGNGSERRRRRTGTAENGWNDTVTGSVGTRQRRSVSLGNAAGEQQQQGQHSKKRHAELSEMARKRRREEEEGMAAVEETELGRLAGQSRPCGRRQRRKETLVLIIYAWRAARLARPPSGIAIWQPVPAG